MKIAITYDLRDEYLKQGYSLEETAELDSLETIDAIASALQKQGFLVERVGNIYQLTSALAAGKRWDLVFNIAEGLHGLSREAQVPALLDAYNIPYVFSSAVVLAITLDKAFAKHIVRDHHVPTAPFLILESLADLNHFNLTYPVFAKPIAEGTGKGVTACSRIDNALDLKKVCARLLQTYRQPVLVETFLPGREFTVGIIGSGSAAKVMGVMEIVLRNKAEDDAYSFHNKEHYEDYVDYKLVEDNEARQAAEAALKAWRVLRCQDSGRVDLRSDQYGVPQFLEVNPIAGLHPVRSDLIIMMRLLGYSYDDVIRQIVLAALKRLNLPVSSSELLCA